MDWTEIIGEIEEIIVDLRQTKEWGDYVISRGWKREWVRTADGKGKLQVLILANRWLPLGWMKLQRNETDPNFEDVAQLRRKYKVLNSAIEPQVIQQIERYRGGGYRENSSPFLPLKTIVIDLSKDEQILWNNLSENARRLIRKNKDLAIVPVEIDTFFEWWKKSAKVWTLSKKDLTRLMKAFGTKARMEVVEKDGEFHAGLVTLNTTDTCNYFITWTATPGRVSGAHFRLTWEAILRAKREGKKYFDFEGIYDPKHPIKKWLGFTEFKKKFGGEEKTFPGSFSRWL